MRSSSSVSLEDEGGVVFEAVIADLIESEEDWREEDVDEGLLMLRLEELLLYDAGSLGVETVSVAMEMLLILPVSGLEYAGLAVELWPFTSSDEGVLWWKNSVMTVLSIDKVRF